MAQLLFDCAIKITEKTLHHLRGLGEVVRAQGVSIIERTPVESYASGRLTTSRGRVRATSILRATEGYTESIKGQQRQLIPIYSKMVATEPLPASVWDEIGLASRETFGDCRRVTIYGQRTLDDRIAFGGRAGYLYGSGIQAVVPPDDPDIDGVERSLKELFPILNDYKVTHRWGGLLGVPRHWRPFVTFDPRSGLGAAGGYSGEGVGASNLAGRILADLVLGKRSDLTTLAWVGDLPAKWEPEPLRWLGANAIQWFGDRADSAELLGGKPSKFWGRLFDLTVG